MLTDRLPPTPIVDVSYGAVTDLGKIVLPSPPDDTAQCTADLDAPAGSVTCTATPQWSGGTTPLISWDFDPKIGQPTDTPVATVTPTFVEKEVPSTTRIPRETANTQRSSSPNTETSGARVASTLDGRHLPLRQLRLYITTSLTAPVTTTTGLPKTVAGQPYTVTATVMIYRTTW